MKVTCAGMISARFREFSFEMQEFRGGGSTAPGCAQIQEVRFFNEQGSALAPDTFTPFPGGGGSVNEDLANAFDGNLNTKWCDTGLKTGSFYFSFTSPVRISSYEWVTGDTSERDPVSWRLQGRNTAADPWTELHSIIQAPVPTARRAVVGPYTIGGRVVGTCEGCDGRCFSPRAALDNRDVDGFDMWNPISHVQYAGIHVCTHKHTHTHTHTNGTPSDTSNT